MITLRKLPTQAIEAYLAGVDNAPFSYDAVGCVVRGTPAGFVRDESVFELGHGEAVFDTAIDAIRNWIIFPQAMVSVVRSSDAIRVGVTAAVVCRGAGLWTINPARILATHDEVCEGVRKFGFTYGTLPGHVERGEERFCVERDLSTDRVTYRITAVSRPSHPLCWMAYPYARWMQAKFRKLSGEAMLAFVTPTSATTPTQLAQV